MLHCPHGIDRHGTLGRPRLSVRAHDVRVHARVEPIKSFASPTGQRMRLLRQLRHLNGVLVSRGKRRAHADLDRADSDEGCGSLRSFPNESNHPPALAWGAGQFRFANAGSARARPLGVSKPESGVEATVGPSCGIHLNVWKRFSLVAARVAESCFNGVGRRPFWSRWSGSRPRWVWGGTGNPYRSYSSRPRACRDSGQAGCASTSPAPRR